MSISNYMDMSLIKFIDAATREDAIATLIEAADKAGKLTDKEAFTRAVEQREKIVSTGIGLGVAIPHARLGDVEDFFIVLGIHQSGGIPWDALDGSAVKLIFLIGGPASKQTEYLKILSEVTKAIKQEKLRKALLSAKKPQDIMAIFEQEVSTSL